MNADWQSWAAVLVVVATFIVFLRRALKKKHGGCNTCGSASPPVKRR